jgi:serine phosphatase RsbU (regulator of sigma subunit)
MSQTLVETTGRPRFRQPCAEDLCISIPSVTSEQTNQDVIDVFNRRRDMATLPVTENERPIGLINRSIFMSQISKPFYQELYNRKSCIAFMDKEPLVVEASTSLEALTFKAVEYGEKALSDGFIIAREGRYLGIGLGIHLMRLVADTQAERNRQIMHSIDYASNIQRAMLRTSRNALARTLPDANLVWEPRDVVGGDFYHFASFDDGWFAAVADCTGHGVPGAFMTLISSSILGQALERQGPRDPAALLMAVNRGIKQMLGQIEGSDEASESDDGMDAAFFWFDNASRCLTFAGARSWLFVLHPDEPAVGTIDGERVGVGYVDSNINFTWTNHTVQTRVGTVVFASTDGLVDQIGGPKEIAFGKRRIRDAILANRQASASFLTQAVLDQYHLWKGDQRRRDDLTVFCFRVLES